MKIQRAAIYIRVSTFEQSVHGKSLQSQREFLEQYAKENDMRVVGIFADEGQTARKELKKRKAIHALLESVKRDEVDIILFWKMDRWFRNVADFYKVQDILDAHDTKWLAVAEPNINLETRDGRLQLNIMLSIGQNEVDTTSERIKFTVDNMIKNKRLVWGEINMPLGYKVGETNGVKSMVKDENTSPIVEEVYKYFLKHQNKRGTVKHIQDTFGIDFSYGMLKTMLSSEFYIGKYRGVDYCPAYLTIDEWEKIQNASKRNVKNTPSGRVYLFSGMIRCPLCGQILVGTGTSMISNRKTGAKRTYCYYRCNRCKIDRICKYNHIMSQNLIERHLLENLEVEYNRFRTRFVNISEKQIKRNKQESVNLKRELTNLNTLFQKGRIEWEYYDKEYQRIKSSLEAFEKCNYEASRDFSRTETVFQSDFREQYEYMNDENRRAFWRSLIERIYINKNNEVTGVDFF